MKLGRIILLVALVKSGLFFALPVNAQDVKSTLENLWGTVKSEGENIIEKSIDITADLANEIGVVLDAELNNLKELQVEPSEVDIRDKIDTIRIYVDEVSELKKQEVNASSFTLISKSKKDFRIKIDEVLKDIEPVLFDGEVVNYASKIRNARQQIIQLNKKKFH